MMPIDPSILQGLKPAQFPDPLERYKNVLSIQGAQNQLAKYEQETAATDAYNKGVVIDPITGKMDYAGTQRNFIKVGQGSLVPGSQAKWDESVKTGLETEKLNIQTIAEHFKQSGNLLAGVNDPEGLKNWYATNYQNPFLKKMYDQQGASLEKLLSSVDLSVQQNSFVPMLEDLKKQYLGIDEAMKTQLMERGLGDRSLVQRIPVHGGAATNVGGSEFKIGESPNKPETSVKVYNAAQKGEEAYTTEFSKEMSKEDHELRRNTQSALNSAERAKQMLNVLHSNQELITGFAAEPRLAIAKFGNLVFGTDANDIMNTEVMISNLGKNTLESFKLLGLTGKQMDTPAEREFLEKAATGKINLDRASLIKLAELSHKAAENMAVRWNQRAPRIPKSAIQSTGLDISPIIISPYKRPTAPKSVAPKAGGFPAPPPEAVADLRAAPDTASKFDDIFGPGAAAKALKVNDPGIARPGIPR